MSSPPSLDIAVLDDDDALRDAVIVAGLRRFGFNATGMATPSELYRALLSRRFHIVILDVDLPDEDGITVAYHLRSLDATLGILMLSAHGEEPERIASLDCGADGYLVKPVSIELLAAHLHSLWRRIGARQAEPRPERPLDAPAPGGWYLPRTDGTVIPLSRPERQMLDALVAARGTPCRREALIAAITADVHDFDPGRLDVLVHRLRRKLAESSRSDLALVTVRGTGYAMVAVPDA